MKKICGIVFLILFWCNLAVEASQQQYIDRYFSDRKLDLIEGIWAYNNGIKVIAKTGNVYSIFMISHNFVRTGKNVGVLQKGSNNYYYGNGESYYGRSPYPCRLSFNVDSGGNYISEACTDDREGTMNTSYQRIWPQNLSAHNSKFEKKKVADKAKDENKVQASSGSAFFVTNKGHIVTNYHVVEGCKDKSKIIHQGNEYKVKLLAKDKYLDLALLKADLNNEKYIVLSNESPKKLQRIIAAGYPLGKELSDDLKFTSGIISSLKGLEDDSTRIQIDAALNHGNSGGPIVDEETGELVAVAVAGLDKKLTESINFGIKAGSVKNFLDSNQIDTILNVKKFNLGKIDLASILENATVYTYCK